MSRGLGVLQREIKRMLTAAFEHRLGGLRFATIREVLVANDGGDPLKRDKLPPTRERSLKRALERLLDRGDVVVIGGKGGPGDPRRYITIECFARSTGQKVKNTAHAKQIAAEMSAAVQKAMAHMASKEKPKPTRKERKPKREKPRAQNAHAQADGDAMSEHDPAALAL